MQLTSRFFRNSHWEKAETREYNLNGAGRRAAAACRGVTGHHERRGSSSRDEATGVRAVVYLYGRGRKADNNDNPRTRGTLAHTEEFIYIVDSFYENINRATYVLACGAWSHTTATAPKEVDDSVHKTPGKRAPGYCRLFGRGCPDRGYSSLGYSSGFRHAVIAFGTKSRGAPWRPNCPPCTSCIGTRGLPPQPAAEAWFVAWRGHP